VTVSLSPSLLSPLFLSRLLTYQRLKLYTCCGRLPTNAICQTVTVTVFCLAEQYKRNELPLFQQKYIKYTYTVENTEHNYYGLLNCWIRGSQAD
jgi:hypothetical protein